jgi:hypothetical protein
MSCMLESPSHISLIIHCMFICENKGDDLNQTSVIDVKFKVRLHFCVFIVLNDMLEIHCNLSALCT